MVVQPQGGVWGDGTSGTCSGEEKTNNKIEAYIMSIYYFIIILIRAASAIVALARSSNNNNIIRMIRQKQQITKYIQASVYSNSPVMRAPL